MLLFCNPGCIWLILYIFLLTNEMGNKKHLELLSAQSYQDHNSGQGGSKSSKMCITVGQHGIASITNCARNQRSLLLRWVGCPSSILTHAAALGGGGEGWGHKMCFAYSTKLQTDPTAAAAAHSCRPCLSWVLGGGGSAQGSGRRCCA